VNINPHIVAHDWDKDASREELLTRLGNLKRQAFHCLPILDDDDLEAAIEEAADQLTHRITE
jgi:hypothetical protein